MERVKDHLELLGCPVTDRVTGFSGIVASVSFDLYGCVQAVVSQRVHTGPEAGQKIGDSHWFDVKRLKVEGAPVMVQPDFVAPEAGGEAKPIPASSR